MQWLRRPGSSSQEICAATSWRWTRVPGALLWQFQTGSGIIGSPITYELDGRQYVAVPSGGIGGDMIFYYSEPKAGNLWVFALDGGGPATVRAETNLTTLKGALPRVGQPGHTLGGRVLPGYGFPATEGGEPLKGVSPPQPTSATQSTGQPVAIQSNPLLGEGKSVARGSETYLARCVGCHKSGGGSGPNLFKTKLSPMQFFDVVARGRKGTVMPSFSSLLTIDQVWEVHAFLMSRDGL